MIKILSLFSGIGAFEKALTNLGLPHEVVNYCEIDPHASKAYSVIHGVSEDKNLRDVTAVDTSKLPDDLDLVTYGFPCVPAGYMVRTFLGYKPIEEIRLHDTVLTHTNSYHEVVKTMSRVSDHINHIKAVGTWDLQVTDEHPLYVLRNNKFKWVKAKDLSLDDRLTFNINTDAFPADVSDDVLWLMGRYFADGYKEKRKPHRVIFCIGKHKEEEFRQHINGISFTVSHKERSSVEYRLTDKKVMMLFEYFSTGSSVKEIPRWIIDLPKEQLLHFFNGYYSGDGYTKKGGMKTFGTVSLKMFLSLQEIVIKLFNVVPTVYVRKDGRKESYHDSYCAQFSLHPKDQRVIKDKICVKIKNIHREVKSIDVYNFEVKDDNSYTVNNVIVHNCQDISVAGKQRGFEDEDGYTRSGLFYEALRIIKDTQPRVAIAENVKALTSNKFKKEFNSVLSSLTNIGYMNFWAVLNAKDFGIPQNRERVFIVSVRNDIDSFGFQFPRPVELKLRLKDMLEDNVDEKYYLKGERVDKFLEELRLSGYESKCLRHERTEYAKQIRKEYEAGLADERRCNLRQYGAWDDGVSNTITTVQKDNYIAEPNIKTVGNLDGHETGRILDADGITQSLKGTDYKNPVKIVLKQVGEIGPHQTDRVYDPSGISRALKSTDYTHPVNIVDAEVKQIGNLLPEAKFNNTQPGRVYDPEGCCPTINTMQGGSREPKILQVGQLYSDNNGNLQNGRIYDPEGCSPALHTMQGGGQKEPKILQVGQLLPEDKVRSPQAGRVYSSEGLYGTITTMNSGNLMPKILTDEPAIAAMRGRNPDNSGDRRPGIPTEQRLEINASGTSNTITTVQKDNYVIEPKNTGCKALGNIGVGGERGIIYDSDYSMCTLSATQYKDPHKVMHQYRIRKLTPKECWRLMGFDDADFDKAKDSGISNSQLYKQAGNSIVVQVLEALFRQVKEFF